MVVSSGGSSWKIPLALESPESFSFRAIGATYVYPKTGMPEGFKLVAIVIGRLPTMPVFGTQEELGQHASLLFSPHPTGAETDGGSQAGQVLLSASGEILTILSGIAR
jgi:hypothetical protein